jgi:hypothetical protein
MIPIARLLLVVLAALAVLMLILAIFDTDDAWLVLVTAVSIALIALVVVIDVWRAVVATGDDAQRESWLPTCASSSRRCARI